MTSSIRVAYYFSMRTREALFVVFVLTRPILLSVGAVAVAVENGVGTRLDSRQTGTKNVELLYSTNYVTCCTSTFR